MLSSLTLRASLVSVALLGAILGLWHVATMGSGPAVKMDPEYAKLMGTTATQGKSAMPGPLSIAMWRVASRVAGSMRASLETILAAA